MAEAALATVMMGGANYLVQKLTGPAVPAKVEETAQEKKARLRKQESDERDAELEEEEKKVKRKEKKMALKEKKRGLKAKEREGKRQRRDSGEDSSDDDDDDDDDDSDDDDDDDDSDDDDDDDDDDGVDYSYYEFSDMAPNQFYTYEGEELKKIFKVEAGKFEEEHPGCFELAINARDSEDGLAAKWGWCKPGTLYGATFYRYKGAQVQLHLHDPPH
jgi:hypothetical protein